MDLTYVAASIVADMIVDVSDPTSVVNEMVAKVEAAILKVKITCHRSQQAYPLKVWRELGHCPCCEPPSEPCPPTSLPC